MAENYSPMIPLAFRPTQFPGLDLGNAAQNAGAMMQARQMGQQMQQQNALRGILGAPGAIDPTTGSPTPETMQKVMAVSPDVGMKLHQNALVGQMNQLRMQGLTSDVAMKQRDMMYDALAPIQVSYEKNLTTMTPEEAQRQAQEQWSTAREGLRTGGGLTPEQINRIPTNFDPVQAKNFVIGSDKWREMMKEQRDDKRLEIAERNADRQASIAGMGEPKNVTVVDKDGKERKTSAFWDKQRGIFIDAGTHQIIDGNVREDKGSETPNWQPMYDSQNKDANGNPTLYYYDAKTRQAVTANGEPYTPQGAQKVSAASNAGKSGLTPDAIDRQADLYHQTGQLPAGFRNAADRTAIMNREAEKYADKSLDPSRFASVKADQSSLTNLTKQKDAAQAYERSAKAEFDNVLKSIPNTPEPLNSQLLTRWVRSGEKQFGDIQVPVYQTYLISALEEYAKILMGATGAAGSTDAARAIALKMIPDGATSAQIPAIVDAIKTSIDNRMTGYDDQISNIKGRLTPQAIDAGEAAAKASTGQTKPPPAQGGEQQSSYYTGSAPPKSHPDAKQAKDGRWYIQENGNWHPLLADEPAAQPAQSQPTQSAEPAAAAKAATPAKTVKPLAAPDLTAAREAIKRGAPRDKVIQRIREAGFDPGDL